MVMIFSFVFLFFLFYVYICVYIYMYLCVCIYNNHTSRLDQNRYPHRGVLLLLLFPFSPGQSRNGSFSLSFVDLFFFQEMVIKLTGAGEQRTFTGILGETVVGDLSF